MNKTAQHPKPKHMASKHVTEKIWWFGSALLLLSGLGCGSSTSSSAPSSPSSGPQTYFAPYVAGTNNIAANIALQGAKIYAVDDTIDAFTESTFQLAPFAQQGSQVINAGIMSSSQRGLLSLGITTNYVLASSGNSYVPINFNPPKSGGFALELAGQAGGLIQLVGQPASPLVAATECPNAKTTQTYQFVTVAAGLTNSVVATKLEAAWNPATDTAYGDVDISAEGTSITFNNIHQHTLPSVGGAGTPTQQPPSSVVGGCGPTVFGNTISVGQLTVTNPTEGGGLSTPPQAYLGIGPSGLLVEYNGAGEAAFPFPGTTPNLFYDNTLGAGTGAIGLPKPSSAVNMTSLLAAQYLGFVYGAGVYSGNSAVVPTGWSSHLTSFGFPTVPSGCASVAAASSTLIYGGDFTNDDPSTSSNGFGNCNLAIDLGAQDNSNNGLFPNAKVWLGAGYKANTTGTTYSFPAVAIAGQLNGKNAIFVLGVDSTQSPQPWEIYLLQSN